MEKEENAEAEEKAGEEAGKIQVEFSNFPSL
jgi:hypothetical protein